MPRRLPKGLIVSCQALNDEPLHSPFIMGRMALAALQGGAKGIRANSVDDINEIANVTGLPIIGIIKRDYPDSNVYITATMSEVDALMDSKADVIAMDATSSVRPSGESLESFVAAIRKRYPECLLMADCSTVEEAMIADQIGFDYIGTTLVGYTQQSTLSKIESNDFEIIRQILSKVNSPVIAEGNIDTPEKARRVLELGCHSVVVGSIITRPQVITKRFAQALK
ncbi:N-acetylmannosamine-6-phosphate 2-epimerase [Erysipelothrix sp. HDW6C]|uniref:N-acetylmannosamine-6-phosphate 2-epimerase n=1 Tax=Erysipelothrix sp. HDW6C TaxID=2714930 RepID=UPI001409479B|nr:N-acetylmannosamine-6-phosphate 2-epimerase [Erysipelothrix sp. HDW6C]QIK70286.1 N-acetylmannosamine-6-phosphate 2-epimerase [Erysipelothrix sp. HDW6C]